MEGRRKEDPNAALSCLFYRFWEDHSIIDFGGPSHLVHLVSQCKNILILIYLMGRL